MPHITQYGLHVPACLFCSVVDGSLGVDVVLTTETTVAFLDHRPVFKGHTLVIPKIHVETLADLPAELVGPYFADVRLVAVAVQQGLGADGSFVALNNKISQSVPHLHTHVVPRKKGDGLRGFFWPRTKYSGPDEAASFAGQIRAAL